ncbi:MAG: DoxX family protein [Ignavibacteriaceae bacterium]|nr:DoxX family protein [Ignavibacteriaceae bacterium]
MPLNNLDNNQNLQNAGVAVIRIIAGVLVFYHGLEIFQPDIIKMYLEWEKIKALPSPVLMTYLGKLIELAAGACLALGLFTRTAALLIAVNMLFICFYVGNGKFYYEDQHPFLFALLAMIFFFKGPGSYALEKVLFRKKLI